MSITKLKDNCMTFEDVARLEEFKEKLDTDHYTKLCDTYTKLVKDAIRWFAVKYPKRTIKWSSGMGTCFWVLDHEILHWNTLDMKHTAGMWSTYYVDAEPDKRAERLLPLWYIYQSINDATHVHGAPIDTGDITMEDV
tara:strand:- start:71120 stop:71533 length:414 start_codon:yes stop_codon:yes gene_type:complete